MSNSDCRMSNGILSPDKVKTEPLAFLCRRILRQALIR